jgi:hypothetical protein
VLSLTASIRIPEDFRLDGITLSSPDLESLETLPVSHRGPLVEFRIPRLEVYDLVNIRLVNAK